MSLRRTKRIKLISPEPLPPKALQVVMIVSDIYGVSVDKILGRERRNDIKVARHVAMARLFEMGDHRRKNTITTKRMIGKWFGGRDHSTVIHAIENVNSWIKNYDDMRIQYETLVRATSIINLNAPVKLTLAERIQRLPKEYSDEIVQYIEKIEKLISNDNSKAPGVREQGDAPNTEKPEASELKN